MSESGEREKPEGIEELDPQNGSATPVRGAAADDRVGQRPAPDLRTTIFVITVPGIAFAVVLAIFALLLR